MLHQLGLDNTAGSELSYLKCLIQPNYNKQNHTKSQYLTTFSFFFPVVIFGSFIFKRGHYQ